MCFPFSPLFKLILLGNPSSQSDIINDKALLAFRVAASGCHASHLFLVEVMTGETQFNIDTKELGANNP